MSHFLKLGFTPSKAEQSLRGMELQEIEEKDENRRGELFRKNSNHSSKESILQAKNSRVLPCEERHPGMVTEKSRNLL